MEAFLCGVTEIPSQQLEAKCKEFAADNQLLDQLLAVCYRDNYIITLVVQLNCCSEFNLISDRMLCIQEKLFAFARYDRAVCDLYIYIQYMCGVWR